MRITTQMMTNGAIQHIQENQEALTRMRERLASGKNYVSASDDPVNASAGLSLQSSVRSLKSYIDSNGVNNDWMDATDFSMQEMETLANRVINLVQKGLNDTSTASERASTIAPEVNGLLDNALALANTKHNGQYIFAGYSTTTQPFSLSTSTDPLSGATLTSVDYDGDAGLIQRSLAPNQSVAINVRGDQAFQSFLQTIVDARDALQNNDTASLRTALTGLQSGLTTMDQHRTALGARLRQVETAADYLDKAQLEAKSLLSKKEDVNMAEAISILSGQETTYKAVLEVSQRAISATSLFDVLG